MIFFLFVAGLPYILEGALDGTTYIFFYTEMGTLQIYKSEPVIETYVQTIHSAL